MNDSTSTVPYSHTRPRSLRPRSTSITCSARSFFSGGGRRGGGGVVSLLLAPRAGGGGAERAAGAGQRADDLEVLEVEEVHVRRRVDRPQPAVDRERVDVDL